MRPGRIVVSLYMVGGEGGAAGKARMSRFILLRKWLQTDWAMDRPTDRQMDGWTYHLIETHK